MISILPLDKRIYGGSEYAAEIESDAYLSITPSETGFSMQWVACEGIRMPLRDVILGDWLENGVAYGAFEDGELLGFVEGFLEKWNNRFRITNICVFRSEQRRRGLGSMLMRRILEDARASGARMAVLETQTFNARGVAFYRKNGFSLIGFDLYAYSNHGPEEHNVRLEMGKTL